MTIVVLQCGTSLILDGVNRLKDRLHETTETGGEMQVPQMEGMTATGVVAVRTTGIVVVVQTTGIPDGVAVRRRDRREADPAAGVVEVVVVEMNGKGMIGRRRAVTTLTDVTTT